MTIIKETFRITVLKLVTSLVLEYQCRFDFVAGSFFCFVFYIDRGYLGNRKPL